MAKIMHGFLWGGSEGKLWGVKLMQLIGLCKYTKKTLEDWCSWWSCEEESQHIFGNVRMYSQVLRPFKKSMCVELLSCKLIFSLIMYRKRVYWELLYVGLSSSWSCMKYILNGVYDHILENSDIEVLWTHVLMIKKKCLTFHGFVQELNIEGNIVDPTWYFLLRLPTWDLEGSHICSCLFWHQMTAHQVGGFLALFIYKLIPWTWQLPWVWC